MKRQAIQRRALTLPAVPLPLMLLFVYVILGSRSLGAVAVTTIEGVAPLDSVRALAAIRIPNNMGRQFKTAIIEITRDEKITPAFQCIYHIRGGVTREGVGGARAFA